MGDTIRWGIVGTGSAAQAFARDLALVPQATLMAVCSRTDVRAQAFAAALGVSRVYADASDLLSDPEVDVVYIATPSHRHRPDALAAIEAGKAVLVEKPFALGAAEAREMAAAARRRNVFCMEAMWMRFMPLVRRVKQLVADGIVGRVVGLTADFAWPVADEPGSRFFDSRQGGGALLERGIYCLSLAQFLLGRPVTVCGSAVMTGGGVDATSAYVLTYGSGATAVLWSSLCAHGTNEAVVLGTQANLRLHAPFFGPHRLSLTAAAPPARALRSVPAAPGLADRVHDFARSRKLLRRLQTVLARPDQCWIEPIRGTGYQFEAEAVMNCLRSGMTECPTMTLDETVRTLETVDALREQWPTPRTS
jgi:predicted dehydrogenase